MKLGRTPTSAIIIVMAVINLFLTSSCFAQKPAEDAIIGVWEADDGTVKLDMFKNGTEFKAYLLYGNDVVEADRVTFKMDTKNPDPSLRSRSLKRIVFIKNLQWNNGKWSGGSLYDGSSGRPYRCEIEIKGDKMHLRGYLGISLLGQTRIFHRASQ